MKTIIISGLTGKVISGLEHLERIARTGESEWHKVVFGGDCKKSFESGEMMIEQSKAQKILEQLGGDGDARN